MVSFFFWAPYWVVTRPGVHSNNWVMLQLKPYKGCLVNGCLWFPLCTAPQGLCGAQGPWECRSGATCSLTRQNDSKTWQATKLQRRFVAAAFISCKLVHSSTVLKEHRIVSS